MEISSSVALFVAVGTQVISSLGLFWAVTSSFNNRINDVESKLNTKIDSKFDSLSKEINEVKKEVNEIKVEQAKIEGRLSSLEQTVRYILDCFPRPRLAIQNPQDNQ